MERNTATKNITTLLIVIVFFQIILFFKVFYLPTNQTGQNQNNQNNEGLFCLVYQMYSGNESMNITRSVLSSYYVTSNIAKKNFTNFRNFRFWTNETDGLISYTYDDGFDKVNFTIPLKCIEFARTIKP